MRSAIWVVLVVLLLTFAGVQAQDETVIEYWNINNEGFGGAVVDALIAEFEAANPGIQVEARVQESYPALVQNVEAQIVAGNPPAVVQIGWPYIDYVYNNLPYIPVSTLVESWGGEDYLATFPQNVLDLTDLGGGQIGMAYSLSNPVVYYNAEMFEAAGLDPDNPPTTWEGWLEIAPKLAEANNGIPVFNFGYGSDNWILQAFVESNGGRMLTCVDGEYRTGLDSPEAAAGLQAWADLVLAGQSLNAGYNDATPAFIAGETVTYTYSIAGRGNIQAQSEYDVRATTFPQFGDNPVRIPGGGNFLTVFATDPAQQEAAWKFVQFLTSPKGFTEWTKGLGYVPLLPGLTEDPAFLADFVAENPIQQVAINQLGSVVRWTSFPGANGLAAGDAAFRATQAALSGELTAAEALAAAAEEINALIAGQACSG
ncbi:MAG: ABC transporter substrate-binding protein [Chloroflexi bacterium]|nr:ABC transporter substrate-binding protein [Chloroflexota bacterium]